MQSPTPDEHDSPVADQESVPTRRRKKGSGTKGGPTPKRSSKGGGRRHAGPVVVDPGRTLRFRRPLSEAELARVLERLLSTRGVHAPARAFVELWDVILEDAEGCSYSVARSEGRGLVPNDYALPLSQCEYLIEAFCEGQGARVRSSVVLTWRNSGPAAYVDAVGDDVGGTELDGAAAT